MNTEMATAVSEGVIGFLGQKMRPHAKKLHESLLDFVENEVMPAEAVYEHQLWSSNPQSWDELKYPPPIYWELMERAKKRGLFNLFLSKAHYPKHGVDLTNLEYMLMAEVTGRCFLAPYVTNCNAPDTGNMEVIAKYGSPEQQEEWLPRLLDGKIQSAFVMTERFVGSSDATNIKANIQITDTEVIINGHKWWNGNTMNPLVEVFIFLGMSDPNNPDRLKRHSIVLIPAKHPGIRRVRQLTKMGYPDVPDSPAELIFDNVRVPRSNLVLGPGRGFEIIQGRLGPGRLHHCARSLGAAALAIDRMVIRATDPKKKTFGNLLADHGAVKQVIAKSRAELEMMRFLTLQAADRVDAATARGALKELGMAKFVVPKGCAEIIDRAIQLHGAEGVSQDVSLSRAYAQVRAMRIADGPDEVHMDQIGRRELRRAEGLKKHFDKQEAERDRILAEVGAVHETQLYKTQRQNRGFGPKL